MDPRNIIRARDVRSSDPEETSRGLETEDWKGVHSPRRQGKGHAFTCIRSHHCSRQTLDSPLHGAYRPPVIYLHRHCLW